MTPRRVFFQGLIPVILILLSSVVQFGNSCCGKDRVTTLIDTAIDIISKVKLENISCPEEHEEHSENNSACNRPVDCSDLYKNGHNTSGVYTVWPVSRLTRGESVEVYCDMTDGGWTVIQRRGDFGRPNDFFNQDWATYKRGFGNPETDFWLGNDNIFAMTNQRLYSVRFDLEDKQQNKAFAQYDFFWIDDDYNNYTLHVSGFSGNAGDSLSGHNLMKFTTKDRNDVSLNGTKCGIKNKNGWWFRPCYHSNLNGIYNDNSHGVIWWSWKKKMESLPRVEMKIKPSEATYTTTITTTTTSTTEGPSETTYMTTMPPMAK